MRKKNSYFKYRPLYHARADGKREPHPFTKSIFEKAEIYYAAPKDFNDPFDCNLRLHSNGSSDAEWESLFRSMMPPDGEIRRLLEQAIQEMWWKTKPDIANSLGKEHHERVYKDSSVFCLSRKGNSIPMFSYYSDSHQGIAIQFDFDDPEVPCGFSPEQILSPIGPTPIAFSDVDYFKDFPELNYHRLQGKTQLIKSLLFTKHEDWSHEEEFRIVRHHVAAGNVQFAKRLLTGVIFGCKTTGADMELVKSWLQEWPTDVVLAKATQATDKFELKIQEVEVVRAKTKN